MKKFLMLLGFLSVTCLFAAEFIVTAFNEQSMSIELQRNPVKDVNGEYAALIKISTDLLPFTFETSIGVVKTESKIGEFWAYVPGGASQLIFTKSGFNRYRYSVPITIKKNTVYTMTLSSKGYGVDIADENLVQITFNLNENGVFIAKNNSAPIQQSETTAFYKIPQGNYTFTFSKSGFEDVSKQINAQQDETITITMQQGQSTTGLILPGFIDITSQPEGAEIFINDQKMGVTPTTIELTAGEHTLKLRKNLYHTYTGSFELQEKETKTLEQFNLVPKFGYYQVSSTPSSAQVFLDGKPVGTTPIAKKVIASGTHQLRVNYNLYHEYEEEFAVQDGDDKKFNFNLIPAFGTLVINSSPESEARVYVDDQSVGTTPYTKEMMPSGQYRIRIDKELWLGAEEIVTITDEQQTEKTLLLTRNFATLKVTSPDADIYLNDEFVGKGTYQKKLEKGQYALKATKEKHHDATQNVHIIPGNDLDINLELQPMLSSLSVQSNPYESKGAEIWLNDKKQKETTPGVMELLVGDYNVTLKHPKFLDNTQTITLKENDQKKLVFEMNTYEGSMLAKKNKWRTSKWISLASTVIFSGAGVYCNMQGDASFDEYESSTTTSAAVSNRKDMESWYDKRDISYGVSIAPAVWFIYSWIKEAGYNKQAQK